MNRKMWTISSDDFGAFQVSENDLKCLTKGQRLTDNVMDFIMTELVRHFEDTLYIPFFYTQLGLQPDKFRSKNIVLLNTDGEHWIIAIWEKRTCTLFFLDSLRQENIFDKYGRTVMKIFPSISIWKTVDCGLQTRSMTLCGLFCFFNTWWFLAGRCDYDLLHEKTLNGVREKFKEWIRRGRTHNLLFVLKTEMQGS